MYQALLHSVRNMHTDLVDGHLNGVSILGLISFFRIT